jgi:hypothetical protein
MSMKSKSRRDQRKKAQKKKANIRLMALHTHKRQYRCSGKVYRRMTEHHQDVLQNIEFALVSTWRTYNSIDDADVKKALMACLKGVPAEDANAYRLQQALDDIRDLRDDISDDLWQDGLRVVLESVHNHSPATPGTTGYLRFVDQFF